MLKRILAALEEAFGTLETTDIGAAQRVTSLSLDLIRSDNHPCFAPHSIAARYTAAPAFRRRNCSSP